MVEKTDGEGGIERRLGGIRQRPFHIVQVEASEKLRFVRDLVIHANGELIGHGLDLRRGRVGPGAVGSLGIVGQGIAGQDGGNPRIHGHMEYVARESCAVEAPALFGRRHRQHLRGPENLAEPLVLAEVVGAVPAIVKARNHNRPSVSESEFVPVETRNTPRLGDRPAVKEIPRVESGVADEFEHAAVQIVHPGFGDDLRIPRRSMPDFRRQHTRARFNFPDRVHVEVRERRPAHLRVGCVDAVHRKHGGAAALSVDRELLREVRGSVRVGLRARRQQQQLAEVALVERQRRYLLVRQVLAARGLRLRLRRLGAGLRERAAAGQ